MRYDAHIFEPDRERVVHFDKDTDQEAIDWANAQWEGAHWTTTASRFELRRDGGLIHTRERRNAKGS